MLCCAGVECYNVAVFLLGSNRSYLLCLVFVVRYYNCCFSSSDGSFGCYCIQRELSCRERGCFGALSLGVCILILWRDKTRQEKEQESLSRNRAASKSSSQCMIASKVYFTILACVELSILKASFGPR